jgi:hypothetical protein
MRNARGLLLLAALITLIAWQFPAGQLALYPFTLLATYAHEMGHGLTAWLLGANFDSLKLYADGSGLAAWSGPLGRIGRALVAAGGLVGPSVAGSAILVMSRRPRWARGILWAMGAFMGLSAITVTRNGFGFVFVVVAGALLVLAGLRAPSKVAAGLVQVLGVELCVSVFRDLSYMFSAGAQVDGTLRPSDSAAIADALFLPYWFWGALVAATAFLVLGVGLWLALRKPSSASR